jgi:hypothetical protein
MRSMTNTILATLVVLLSCGLSVRAELTGEQEALTIARNYVSFILINEGNWGGSDSAEVVSIQEFERGDRTLGYFCGVQPRGFLVLSLHKELAPVKAYSGRCNLNPEAEEGLTDLIKDKMEGILDGVEEQLGRPLKPDDQIGDLLDIDYRAVSDVLVSAAFDPEEYREPQRARSGAGMNYQEGEVLLTSSWHQRPPYNDQCPDEEDEGCSECPCSWPAYGFFNDSARVGCVATAGAQVMYHWHWPPTGEGPFDDSYDWANMCNEYIYDNAGWFNDENGVPVTWNQINAVAELCNEIGIAVDMDYGCDESGAYTADLLDAYDDYFHYNEGWIDCRAFYDDPVDWFNLLKSQLNVNRPVPYHVEEHAIVGDGWKEEWIGDDYYWYHMNYGWGGGIPGDPNWPGYPNSNTWFPLDELYWGGAGTEYIIGDVVPDGAIGGTLGLLYGGTVHYFDQDASGTDSTFLPGNGLQILKSGFLLVNTGGPTHAIMFYGEPDHYIRFFLEGDLAGKTRISIQGGGMAIHGGGQMVIR